MKYNSLVRSVGDTPHIRLAKLFPRHEVWIKDERRNPAGSIKDRIALAMIEQAESNGMLKPGGVIVEPTSGNTGIGLAMVAAVKGYRLILTMPESMSLERRAVLKALGAELKLSPAADGMKGAITLARKIIQSMEQAWMPMQFENTANRMAHFNITAEEIIRDFPDGIDYLVAGVGTAGHISGLALRLKRCYPRLSVVAVEPASSPVLSGGKAGKHQIQGIGAGFIPDNWAPDVVDRIVAVTDYEAVGMMRTLARSEGMLAGISTGANLAAVRKVLSNTSDYLRVITLAYDSGERYLSRSDLWEGEITGL